ncbi:S-layer homology domain-containing protein [Patescibacteria group bacterium]
MRKYLILALFLVLAVSQISFASFNDVNSNTDYETAISWMADNGVIQGYPDGTFGPDVCVNRVEMLKMLYLATETNVNDLAAGAGWADYFSDVDTDQWYWPYLRFALQQGTVEGYPDQTFKPNQCVNRVEAIKMATLEYNGGNLPVAQDQPNMPYDALADQWYYGYLEYVMYANTLGQNHTEVTETGYNFFPGDSMTRKEVAEMLYRMKAIQDSNVSVYADGMAPAAIVDAVTFTGITSLYTDSIMEDYIDDVVAAYGDGTSDWSYVRGFFEWYEVGEINVAPYEGYKLLVLDSLCDGMCLSSYLYRFAYNEDTGDLVMLDRHSSSSYTPSYVEPLTVGKDTTTLLAGLKLPETIAIAGTDAYITKVTDDDWYNNDDNLTTVAFVDPVVGNVYYYGDGTSAGCLYVKSPDGSVSTYGYDLTLLEEAGVTIDFEDGSGSVVASDSYGLTTGGCGLAGSCYFIRDIELGDLVLAGVSSNGVSLYEVADPVEGIYGEDTAGYNEAQVEVDQVYQFYVGQYSYRDDLEGLTPPTFEEFLDDYPVLYWQDPFGRWSSITGSTYKIPAECGKPVVYLYPEEATDVHVEVDIDEFTVTIPDYGKDGWTVRAQPDGSLYNYADGEEYPYLFWEGHKKDGLTTDQGSMVAKEDLEEFFTKNLAKMGLNKQESADFMEFWVPVMKEDPENYFFVSFIGTHDFNKVAPLTVEPKPDTVIRVFMYYHPTYRPFEVQEQKLSTIPRDGFTVIEWGGTSSRTWRR